MWRKVVKLAVKFAKKQLAVVFIAICILYCFVVMVRQLQDGDATVIDNELDQTEPRREQPFKWQIANPEENDLSLTNSTQAATCRNSVQGKLLITDDRGYVCQRLNVLPSGCCNTQSPSTIRYQCKSCHNNHCCSVYEHCISCCLHPGKVALLQNVLGKSAHRFNLLFASVSDHFELCLAKCRTSSQSVQHENSYRNPRIKYCYGDSAPALQPFAGR